MGNKLNETDGRSVWLDCMKGVAILLVVLGHVMEGAIGKDILEGVHLAEIIDNAIGFFHMPLFFMLSGISFSYIAARNKVKDQCINILVLYFFWSVIMYVLKKSFPSMVNVLYEDHILLCLLFKPISPYWYFLVLFDFYLLHLAFGKIIHGDIAEIIIAVILSAIAPVLWSIGPDKFISYIYRFSFNFIFFLLGIFLRKSYLCSCFSPLQATISNNKFFPFVLILLGLICSFLGNCEKVFIIPFIKMISVICCLLLLLVGSTSLYSSFRHRSDHKGLLPYLGKNVVYIYILHNYLTVAIRVVYIKLGIHLPDLLYVAINLCVTISVCCIIAEVCKRVQLLNLFFMPVKTFVNLRHRKPCEDN